MSEPGRDRGTEPPNPHSPEPQQEDVLGESNSLDDLDSPATAADEAAEREDERTRGNRR